MSAPKQTPIYGNWRMFSPSDELMCRMDQKRALWYVKRELADITEENTIKLRFEPKGNGNAGVLAMVEDKHNRCVVCGAEHNLNRHHIVPYQYRKHFPLKHKARTSYDVVPLCLDCHEQYETIAQLYSIELATHYGIPDYHATPLSEFEHRLSKSLASAKALLKGHSIPEHKIVELQQKVMTILCRTEPLDAWELEEFLKTPIPRRASPGQNRGAEMVKEVLHRDELQQFIENWREHFVDTMKPKFLSPNWVTDFILPR